MVGQSLITVLTRLWKYKMPSLEQIAAQYSISRFPQHPYARAKYEQGFKDGVNSILENEDVNDLVLDAFEMKFLD